MEETINYKDFTIIIRAEQDTFGTPRDWDNLGKMVCFHRDYNLGDTHEFTDGEEFAEYLEKNKKTIVSLPLYLYDHSGITMYTTGDTSYRQHEAWDSSSVGYIYVTFDDIRKEFDIKNVTQKYIERTLEILKGEIKIYDMYLTGDIWRIEITDPNGVEIDNYGDAYGYDEALEEAKSTIDHYDQLPLDQKVKVVAPYANKVHN